MSGRGLCGVGIGLRREIADALLASRRHVDWIEVVSENFAGVEGRPRDLLRRVRERWPVVPHGVALSIGSETPSGYMAALQRLVAEIEPPFVSDHLCYASIGASTFFDLLPLPFTEEAAQVAGEHAREASDRLGLTLLLENITFYATMPGSTMSDGGFLRRVLEHAGPDVGCLLDLNNLYVNAINHGEDPDALLDAFPVERVRQVHLAGHAREGELLLDTHSAPVSEPVWQLYRSLLARTGPLPTLIEWDQNIPDLDAVLDEADRARRIAEAA